MIPVAETTPLGNPHWLWDLRTILIIGTVIIALVIVAKAGKVYHQHADRGMLVLGVGLFLLVVAPQLAGWLMPMVYEISTSTDAALWRVVIESLRFAGMVTILGSLYVRP